MKHPVTKLNYTAYFDGDSCFVFPCPAKEEGSLIL